MSAITKQKRKTMKDETYNFHPPLLVKGVKMREKIIMVEVYKWCTTHSVVHKKNEIFVFTNLGRNFFFANRATRNSTENTKGWRDHSVALCHFDTLQNTLLSDLIIMTH